MQKCAIQYAPEGNIDTESLIKAAQAWAGVEAADLAAKVEADAEFDHSERLWDLANGFADETAPKKHDQCRASASSALAQKRKLR